MWLRIPTSHCSPATEDSTSPSDALCQELAASVSWRGKLLRPQSWRLAWKMEGWRRRLSGLTFEPSQANFSVAAWLDSLVGSPARTSALQGDKQESRESEADCSLRSSDSFASWSPSSGCFLRTSRQFSIFQQEQPFSENLPRSGSMRNGELFERPMLVDRTGESGRLCWPTARSQDSKHGEATDYEMSREEGLDLLHVKAERMMRMWPTARSEDSESCGNHPGAVDSLTGAARMWHTPKAHENAETSGTFVSRNADRGAHCFSGLGAQTAMWRTPAATEEQSDRMSAEAMLRGLQNPNQQINLSDQARMWMTPNLPLGGRKNTAEQVEAKGKTDNGKRQISLEGQTMHWPTPRTITGGAESAERKQETGGTDSGGSDLQSAAANWPTPASCDYRSPNGASHMDRSTGAKHLDQLPNFIEHSFLPAPPTSTHGGKSPSTSTRRLNPDFVDWLMGLPPGWTDYAPLETASYLSRVRSLLRFYLGGHSK